MKRSEKKSTTSPDFPWHHHRLSKGAREKKEEKKVRKPLIEMTVLRIS